MIPQKGALGDTKHIAMKILMTGNLSIIKNMSAEEIAKVLEIIKMYQGNTVKQTYVQEQNKNAPLVNQKNNTNINTNEVVIVPNNDFIGIPEETYSEPDDNNLFDTSTINDIKVNKIQPEHTNSMLISACVQQPPKLNYHIDGKDYVDNVYYNDFLVKLGDNLNDVHGFEIDNVRINVSEFNIHNYNNQLKLHINDNTYNFVIPIGKYDTQTLLATMNKIFTEKDMQCKIELRSDNHIMLSFPQIIFAIDNDKSSVLRLLGFVQKTYFESNEYVSDNCSKLEKPTIAQLKLCFSNIGERVKETIDLPINTKVKINFRQPIMGLSDFIIKIKDKNSLCDLQNTPPQFDIKFLMD